MRRRGRSRSDDPGADVRGRNKLLQQLDRILHRRDSSPAATAPASNSSNRSPAALLADIEGFHYGTNLDKTTTLTLDARAIADQHDYKLKLGIERENIGYLRLSYTEFRTWSDGDGGFFPPSDMNYPLSKDALGLDRGAFSIEAGLTPEKGINAVFKYTHTFREGEEDSTIWGDAHPGNGTLVQGLSPSFDDIHEHADSFQLDLSDHIKTTDLGLGLHYETGKHGRHSEDHGIPG